MDYSKKTNFNIPELEKKASILVVRSPYYKEIADNLLNGALQVFEKHNVQIELEETPGALEIPTVIALVQNNFDGFLALGCVIRGETTHYDTVCNVSAHALAAHGINGICVGNGILNVESYSQALERSDPNKQNKGGSAAEATLSLIHFKQKRQQVKK